MITIDQKIAEYLNKLTVGEGEFPIGNLILVLIALVTCVLLCGVVGFEREKRGRSAGLRTHLLVGLGSCVIMIISIYGFPQGSAHDVARLAAGVLAGVGFLGAGAIIHSNGGIKGLTTAGTIWMAMTIGLACGSFNFILAIAATLIVMIVLIVFRGIERKITKGAPTFIVLADEKTPVMTLILDYAKKNDLEVVDVVSKIVNNGAKDCIETTFKLASRNKNEVDIEKAKLEIQDLTKAINIEALNHH